MARYAMVDASGLVTNVIEWDGDEATWRPPADVTMVEDVASESGSGFTWDGALFIPPPNEELPLEPGTPGGPSLPAPERDYGAEIDALADRVTMLEARVLALEGR